MNPEQQIAMQEMQARQMAFAAASQRAKPEASIDDILADAEKVVTFMKAGASVAVPQG